MGGLKLPGLGAKVAHATLNVLTEQLYAGEISLAQWTLGVAGELKTAHVAQAIAGAGHRLTIGELVRVTKNLLDEFRHLAGFARDIVRGLVSEAQARARIGQYADATQQAYWREWARENDPRLKDLPRLKTVPGAGATQCRGNCNCDLTADSDGLHWNLNPGENCDDCIALAAGGPYRYG